MPLPRKTILISLAVAAMTAGGSLAAQAYPGPLVKLNDAYASRPGDFFLYDRIDRKHIDLAKAQNVRVCVSENRDGDATPKSVAMKVKSAGGIKVIQPGHCMVVDARNLTLRSDGPVPRGWEIAGKVTHRG